MQRISKAMFFLVSTRYSESVTARPWSAIEKGLRQTSRSRLKRMKAPPCSRQELMKLRPSSTTKTSQPAPLSEVAISCIKTDLPEPEEPTTMAL